LELDLWYPATATVPDHPIEYREFIDLLEKRSNRFQDDTTYKTMTGELLQYVAANLHLQDTNQLSHLRTQSYRNAKSIPKRFPLIVYICSFNGMSFENVPLFETLASHGYLVVSITSVGRYPGNMSTSPADLIEQVYDAQFALRRLAAYPEVDTAKMGVIGYSWGGLAAMVLTMIDSDLKCLLSLDGSEIHYYGQSRSEDQDFDQLRSAPFFQPSKVRLPYGYLESGQKQKDRQVDSIFDMLAGLKLPTRYMRFEHSTHEDFSYLSSLKMDSAQGALHTTPIYNQFCQLSLAFANQYLVHGQDGLTGWIPSSTRGQPIDTAYPVVARPKTIATTIIRGVVIDQKNRTALAYVNIGVPGKDLGTVSQRDGTFSLKISQDLRADSLRFSLVGYQSDAYNLADILGRSGPIRVALVSKPTLLAEVVVTSKSPTLKTIGNRTASTFISVGFPLRLLGGETGVKMSLGRRPVWLRRFNFHIASNRLDTAVFRLNLYAFNRGVPTSNILAQNILVRIGKQTGAYSVDLSGYKVIAQGDILVSLEWVEGSSADPEHAAIFFSAGLLNSATWHRQTSQANWKKLGGIGAGFSLEVQAANSQAPGVTSGP
jgi:pimeloyl-ACP methyl ester carboxylesterase